MRRPRRCCRSYCEYPTIFFQMEALLSNRRSTFRLIARLSSSSCSSTPPLSTSRSSVQRRVLCRDPWALLLFIFQSFLGVAGQSSGDGQETTRNRTLCRNRDKARTHVILRAYQRHVVLRTWTNRREIIILTCQSTRKYLPTECVQYKVGRSSISEVRR